MYILCFKTFEIQFLLFFNMKKYFNFTTKIISFNYFHILFRVNCLTKKSTQIGTGALTGTLTL